MADKYVDELSDVQDEEEELPDPPTKKLIGLVGQCTSDSVEGFVAINYGLRILDQYWAVVREDLHDLEGKVAVVGGAPAGHEPYAIGFVGKGMLAGAVAGGVFVSAGALHAQQLFRHINAVRPAGILVIVANSAGQKLNLTPCVDTLREEGILIELFICCDDSTNTKNRAPARRGLAGTVYMMKVAGAMAEEGYTMKAIVSELELIASMLGTIGMNLTQSSFPEKAPSYYIPENKIELGSGLHGEAGIKQLQLVDVKHVVAMLLTHMIDRENPAGLHLEHGDEVVLIVNNLGVMSYLEELMVCRQTIVDLEQSGVRVLRAYHGRLVTSLDMSGVFLSLMKLSRVEGRKERWLKFLDANTDAPAWPTIVMSETSPDRFSPDPIEIPDSSVLADSIKADVFLIQLDARGIRVFVKVLKYIYRALAKRERFLNAMDAVLGDGDTGSNVTSGMRAILFALDRGELQLKHPRETLSDMADIWTNKSIGSSSGLYGLFFSGGARAIHRYEKRLLEVNPARGTSNVPPKAHEHLKLWVDAFEAGIESIMRYGGARPGERTMLDALVPALKVLRRWSGDVKVVKHVLAKAASAARRGASKTARMANAGMNSFVGQETFIHSDPGAIAVTVWFQAIADAVAVSVAGPAYVSGMDTAGTDGGSSSMP